MSNYRECEEDYKKSPDCHRVYKCIEQNCPPEIVELLIWRSKLTPQNSNLLHIAAKNSNYFAAKFLVEHGWDIKKLSSENKLPLDYAIEHNNIYNKDKINSERTCLNGSYSDGNPKGSSINNNTLLLHLLIGS